MGTVKTTTNSDGSTTTSKLRFSYDADGKVVAVNYNGNYYYYLRNAQSDIVKLIDKTGATVVEYRYDSWGKLLSTSGSLASTLGKNNPFRYRGYVYTGNLTIDGRRDGLLLPPVPLLRSGGKKVHLCRCPPFHRSGRSRA